MPRKSFVLIVAAAQKHVAEAVSTVLGHQQPGDETYVVKLSETGAEPATHYGCHTWAMDSFISLVTACKVQGVLPDGVPWAAVGMTQIEVLTMCTALITSAREDGQHIGHFNDVIAANGLQRVADAV